MIRNFARNSVVYSLLLVVACSVGTASGADDAVKQKLADAK